MAPHPSTPPPSSQRSQSSQRSSSAALSSRREQQRRAERSVFAGAIHSVLAIAAAVWRSLSKTVLHVLTCRSELERTLLRSHARDEPAREQLARFQRVLHRSRRLRPQFVRLFVLNAAFETADTADEIVQDQAHPASSRAQQRAGPRPCAERSWQLHSLLARAV